MEVRILNRDEILEALHLSWEVFASDVAPSYSSEGVGEFQKFLKYENIISLFDRREIVFFGAFDMNRMLGVSAVKSIGHISLLFVKKEEQRKGIGRMLFNAVSSYSMHTLRVPGMTVNAAPNAVQVYQRLGMQQFAPQQNVNGIDFIPMQIVYPGNAQQKKPKTGVIIGIIAAIVLVLILAFVGIGRLVYTSINQDGVKQHDEYSGYGEVPEEPDAEEPDADDDGYGNEDDLFGGGEEGPYEDETAWIESVKAYEADDLSFDIDDENYQEYKYDSAESYVDFDVNYPVIKGLDDKSVQDKINKALKDAAMETVDEIYLNPSNETKDIIVTNPEDYLVSYVQYKVTFANNDLISVVFDDNACKITADNVKTHLRTVNISMKDGTIYQVKDIVDLKGKFLDDFVSTMQLEAEDSDFLTEIDSDTIKKALEGKDPNKVYEPEFFIDAEGIEIGFDITPDSDSETEYKYSWVTAPFAFDEVGAYKNKSDFWTYLGDFVD